MQIGCRQPQTKVKPYLGLRGSKPDFLAHLINPQPPTFGGCHSPQNCPNQCLDPVPRPTRLRQAARGSPKRWVPKCVNLVHGVQKDCVFPKIISDHMECQNKCFWCNLSLGNGLFWDQNGSKMGQKCVSQKGILDHLGCINNNEPIFGPCKVTKCLENGLFCNKKWVKNGSKMCMSKNDPIPYLARLPAAKQMPWGPPTPQYARKTLSKGPQKTQNLCTLAARGQKTKVKPYLGLRGYKIDF